MLALVTLVGCGPRPLPPRPPDAKPTIDRIDENLKLLAQAIDSTLLPTFIAEATMRLDAIGSDVHLLGDDNGRLQALVDAQQDQLDKLNDAGTAKDRRTLLWVSIFGLLVVAGGVASMKLLGPGLGGGITAGGTVLSGVAFAASRFLGAIDNAAPWVINGVMIFAGVVALAFAVPHLWRMWRYQQCVGDAAQDKLYQRGDVSGAAALAYAQAGGGNKGWHAAKMIEVAAAVNQPPTTEPPGNGSGQSAEGKAP